MSRKQSFSEHLTIKCPKNTQRMERGTPHAEVQFQQSCCYASLLKSLFSMGAPALCRFSTFSTFHAYGTLRRGCFQCIYNKLIVNIIELHRM